MSIDYRNKHTFYMPGLELEHYGVKGMKWDQHLLSKKLDEAGNYISDKVSDVKQDVKNFVADKQAAQTKKNEATNAQVNKNLQTALKMMGTGKNKDARDHYYKLAEREIKKLKKDKNSPSYYEAMRTWKLIEAKKNTKSSAPSKNVNSGVGNLNIRIENEKKKKKNTKTTVIKNGPITTVKKSSTYSSQPRFK